jgi:hypothetical protein
MQDEFIDDQPPIGTLTPEARESLRLAMADTPAVHPDKAKHTPGPWFKADSNFVYALHEHKGRLVNRFSAAIDHYPTQGGTADEGAANARLIAAAPDLLEALQTQHEAENYIAKNHDSENPFFEATYREMLNYARQLRVAAIAKATGEDPP